MRDYVHPVKMRRYRNTPWWEWLAIVPSVGLFVYIVFKVAPQYFHRGDEVVVVILCIMALTFGSLAFALVFGRVLAARRIRRAESFPAVGRTDINLIHRHSIACTLHRVQQVKYGGDGYDDDPFWVTHAEFASDDEHMRFLMLRPPKTIVKNTVIRSMQPNTRIIGRKGGVL